MKYPDFDGSQLCNDRTIDKDMFFPPSGGAGNLIAREAKKICMRCSFLNECAEWALHHADPYGVYGGMNASDRHQIRKERGIIPDVVTIEQIFGKEYTHRKAS